MHHPTRITYRAAVWTSADRQGQLVLTSPEQAELADAVLLAAAEEEIRRVGLEREDGDLLDISTWTT